MWFRFRVRGWAAIVLAAGCTLPFSSGAQAPDPLIDAAREAWQRRQGSRLQPLAEQALAQQHPLAPWVDYWRAQLALPGARAEDFAAFAQRWPGSYVEDRLRGDWLQELGRRKDWAGFAAEYPRFRMDDERELHCHALSAERALQRAPLRSGAEARPFKERALAAWLAQRDADEACHALARGLLDDGVFGHPELWRKLLRSAEDGRARAFKQAAGLLSERQARTGGELATAWDDPARYLARMAKSKGRWHQEQLAVALVRLAGSDPERAGELLRERHGSALPPSLRQWVGVQLARQALLHRQPEALAHLQEALAVRESRADWSEDTLAWAARVALRGGDWALLAKLLDPLPEALARDSAWPYWRAQALYRSAADGARGEAQRSAARAALQAQAAPLHFYGQLAADELGLKLPLPPAPAPLSEAERQAAAQHPGLQRALRLIQIGLRSEGVREWNFTLRELAGQDRALLAAARLACDAEVWDRCINTSERTQQQIDLAQRYPTPYREQVLAQARAAGLDPADPYGLMRQESRFITDARSGVGASGLMQVMPATARWTAKKIGLAYSPASLRELDVNLRIGMAYLRMVLDDFDGALPLAAAAYNAGPGRPRRWREGQLLDAAAWAETLPFNETRDYVKKVLANATVYARLLGADDARLRQRLGQSIGPRAASAKPVNEELP